MIKTANELKAGDLVRPFISERTMKRTKKTVLIVDGPFECDGEFKDYYITFKIDDPDNDNELLIHSDDMVEVIDKKQKLNTINDGK